MGIGRGFQTGSGIGIKLEIYGSGTGSRDPRKYLLSPHRNHLVIIVVAAAIVVGTKKNLKIYIFFHEKTVCIVGIIRRD